MENDEEKTSGETSSAESTAGRGFIVISIAKVWFMVGGASITFGLPIVFAWSTNDGRELYGQYYDINNTLSIFSMVLIGGLLPAVARFASAHGRATAQLLKVGYRVALLLGGLLCLTFWLGSESYASLRGHPDQRMAYICAGVICAAYGFYAVHVGIINGRKAFTSQAKLDIGFTTMKVCLVMGLASAGMGVTGAFTGFACAAVAIAFWSRTSLPKLADNQGLPNGFISFACWMLLYTLAFNLSFKLDALMIRPALSGVLTSTTEVDQFMGEYGLAVSLSRLPWQSTIALTFVVFPMISEVTFARDMQRTRTYIQNTIRYALLLICAVALPMCARPDYSFECLSIIMPGYSVGQSALMWLAPAYIFFSISNLHNTILMSSGRAKTALLFMTFNLSSIFLAFEFGLVQALAPTQILASAGQLTCLVFGVVSIIGGIWVHRIFGAYLSLLSLSRIALAVIVAVTTIRFVSTDILGIKLLTLVALPIYFLLILWASGELNSGDFARFLRVVRVRKGRNHETN